MQAHQRPHSCPRLEHCLALCMSTSWEPRRTWRSAASPSHPVLTEPTIKARRRPYHSPWSPLSIRYPNRPLQAPSVHQVRRDPYPPTGTGLVARTFPVLSCNYVRGLHWTHFDAFRARLRAPGRKPRSAALRQPVCALPRREIANWGTIVTMQPLLRAAGLRPAGCSGQRRRTAAAAARHACALAPCPLATAATLTLPAPARPCLPLSAAPTKMTRTAALLLLALAAACALPAASARDLTGLSGSLEASAPAGGSAPEAAPVAPKGFIEDVLEYVETAVEVRRGGAGAGHNACMHAARQLGAAGAGQRGAAGAGSGRAERRQPRRPPPCTSPPLPRRSAARGRRWAPTLWRACGAARCACGAATAA